jgi:GNAT superfamily N-acetyltransferase
MTTLTDLNLPTPMLDTMARPLDLERIRKAPAVSYRATELLKLQHHHVGWMLSLMADATIAFYEPLPVPPTTSEAAEILGTFINRQAPPEPTAQGWVILENGRRVGVCQLRRSDEGHLVGVSLQPSARNRGLGTALFEALGAWGLRDGGFVAGEVEDDNVLSHRALQSAGFLARDRYPVVLADGRPTIVTRYEYDAQRAASASSIIDLTRIVEARTGGRLVIAADSSACL